MPKLFTELHARSAFSFLEGASPPEKLVRQAAHLGHESIAITDRGGFYGSARAHHAAREAGIRALVGCTLDLPDGTSFPVLCATRDGYRSMSRHLTDRHLHGLATLPEETRGLIALTGDRGGPVCRPLLRDDRAGALRAAERLIGVFGRDNVFVELHRHGLRDDGRLIRHLRDLAAHLRLPVVASNAPLHATRGDRRLADAFTCLRHHVPLDQAGRLLAPNGERHVKSPAEMGELFGDLPEALDNARRVAERIEFTLENLGYRFPDFPDGQGNPLSLAEQGTLLRRFTYTGAAQRYGICRGRVKRQIEHELAMIQRLGFPGYFLIVHELVEFARGRGILCQGRGSAANSAVCYALGITAVDPIGSGLLFERFLSENRKSWPDIDIDFPSGDRREEVIQHVFRKYGARNAAMTANVITYQPKSAFREMSKVLGFPPEAADRFSRAPGGFRAEGSVKSTEETDFDDRIAAILPPSHPRLPALSHLYHAVLGLPRHLGQHSGGMIVCDHGLDAVVPLQPAAMPGRNVVQWDKDDCEDMGIVKIDLLGLGMLAAMEHALEIRKRRGQPVDLALIPKDDRAVFDLLCRADTVGTFQVESRAQMATLPILRPRTFYDLAIEVAIIRPGPIVGDLVHPYLNRRNGREAIDFIHPSCEDTLKRTLGVPLFQEQVLRMAMDVAGFTGAEADELRRAMAFKRSDERMERVTTKLRDRMTARGIDGETQEKLVASIGSFALYGFPESHAISFALIAYASCWLKVHHPAEFYCGLINHQPMGFYSVNTLIQDARRHGIRIKPVCCMASAAATEVLDDSTLRLGLHRLKGLSAATIGRLLSERSHAPFLSLDDFLRRVRPAAKEKRLLARSGALHSLPEAPHRREAMWQVELPLHDDLLDYEKGSPVSTPGSPVSTQGSPVSTPDSPVPTQGSPVSTPGSPVPTQGSPVSTLGSPVSTPGSPVSTQGSPVSMRPGANDQAPASPRPHQGQATSILPPMTLPERLAADFASQGATTGPHPMALWRTKFQGSSFKAQAAPLHTEHLKLETPPHRANDLHSLCHGSAVRVAGMAICRQRPGTAKGHCFISLEDETGIANLFVPRDTFHRFRLLITSEPFLLAHGRLQRSEGDQPTVYVTDLEPLPGASSAHAASSHDFH